MRYDCKKLTAVTLAAVMAATILSACNNDDSGADEVLSYYFTAQSIPLPDDIGYIANLTYYDNRLYFDASSYSSGSAENAFMDAYSVTDIYSMDITGTDLTRLAGYKPPMKTPDGVLGGVFINTLNIDSDGNLWVAESYNFYGYDLPDGFDLEVDELGDYYKQYGSGNTLRKLDSNGLELLSVDISSLSSDPERLYISMLEAGGGFVYLLASDGTINMTLHVLDDTGNMLFEYPVGDWRDLRFIRLIDGTIALSGLRRDSGGNYVTPALQLIDVTKKEVGGTVDAPIDQGAVFSGGGRYDILISNYQALYGYTIGKGDAVKLIDFTERGFEYTGFQAIYMVSEDEFICKPFPYDSPTGEIKSALILLKRAQPADLTDKTVLTYAALNPGRSNIRSIIHEFNRTNPDYYIEIIDYSQYNTPGDWNAGRGRLSTDIVTGNVPDIFDLWDLPYRQYAARGLLADLYPLIDSDPELSRSDIVPGVLRASEIDGKLYYAFSSFRLDTVVGNPLIVGDDTKWSIDEFASVLSRHPDADVPLGEWMTGTRFLMATLLHNIDKYIDWETGTAHFDSPEFIQYLQIANMFPKDPDGILNTANDTGTYASERETITEGRQIMMRLQLDSMVLYAGIKALFGGDIVFKGFPSNNDNGNIINAFDALAIAESSPHKDGAWAFVRTILNKDWQLGSIGDSFFPTNQTAFNQVMQTALETDYTEDFYNYGFWTGSGVIRFEGLPIENVTQADIELIIDAINSATVQIGVDLAEETILIIYEEASDYFNGAGSAEDAARIIQRRVSILVSERS